MYKHILNLLDKGDIEYKSFKHEPVLDYKKAKKVRERFNFEGVESKSLFIKSKSGKYYVFVTVKGTRLDSKKMKKLLGEKVSIASGKELTEKTDCIPGCAAPFGYSKEITLIIDKNIFSYDKFVFSPAKPEITIEIRTKDIKKILDVSENKIIYY
ncbi:YbaK/EbsC family protein [Thermohalobacter berrensis]|uniref:DNA-binding protein n=1 Tax=Thermohalobacter berrensis TaxID=99594 RepID=A0A419SWB6_9FIRM|nr:YbaK/EbsC family protein [Thermohalobacter berrensis]RKD29495.1 DNA-binding protein [Thermohalobacter berrensis]